MHSLLAWPMCHYILVNGCNHSYDYWYKLAILHMLRAIAALTTLTASIIVAHLLVTAQ